jgi:hypothetical protein
MLVKYPAGINPGYQEWDLGDWRRNIQASIADSAFFVQQASFIHEFFELGYG